MNNHQIHTKLKWVEYLNRDFSNSFYPSLVKKIEKSDDFFKENFSVKTVAIESFDMPEVNEFFELYNSQIASRSNYLYKKDEQKNILKGNLDEGILYFLFGLYYNYGKFAGGLIFSKRGTKFSSALRVFDNEARQNFKSQTTLDFWCEKNFFEYAKSEKIEYITHGTDNYPNVGRIGLPLFKLKLGAKPKLSSKEHEIKELSDEELLKPGPSILFFENIDDNNFFTTCQLFYDEATVDKSVLGELEKVLEWTGIGLQTHKKEV